MNQLKKHTFHKLISFNYGHFKLINYNSEIYKKKSYYITLKCTEPIVVD